MEELPAHHDLGPVTRFSDRAADYVKYRPSYPGGAIGAVLAGLGDPSGLVAADIGAGTGISARLLAERGVRVVAVEPNSAMRQAAEPHPGVEWRDTTAEATGLPDQSVSLIVCAQAFHWFRPGDVLREFFRLLKCGGRVALIWNDRDETDPATAAYGLLVREASDNSPAESHALHHVALRNCPRFRNFRSEEFHVQQVLDHQGLLGRASSASYVPKVGPNWERLVRSLARLHARHSDECGNIRLVYRTRVYLAERT